VARRADAADHLVWMDLEMTGLDVEREVIVEVATLITDANLDLIAEGPDIVIQAPESALENMVPIVREMHAKSGLTEEIRASTTTLDEAEDRTLAFIREHCPKAGQHPLCGNSIATDRRFLLRYMPRIVEHLSYRMVDVSSVKELCRRWYPKAYVERPRKGEGHRALADIRESIEELRYYRRTVFVPEA
jgi:oligoribonuclease